MDKQSEQTVATSTVRAIIHDSYGKPEKVLRVGTVADPGAPEKDSVRVRLTHRPIHPGDLSMVEDATLSGSAPAIEPNAPRVPGFEGSGVIESVGLEAASKRRFKAGQRVTVFPVFGAWSEVVIAPESSVTPIPDAVPDEVASQILINVITARMVLRTGHKALPPSIQGPVYFVQSAAASAVGRLITALGLEMGMKPLRLVRSQASAEALLANFPGAPIVVTTSSNWQEEVKKAAEGHPVYLALDGVGGSLLADLASVLTEGGSVVTYGALGEGIPDLMAATYRDISIRGASVLRWIEAASPEVRAEDIATAIRLAETKPEVFQVAGTYDLAQIAQALEHVGRQGKTGTVLLTS